MAAKNPRTIWLTDGLRVPLARDPDVLLSCIGRSFEVRLHLPTFELAGRLLDEFRIEGRCSDEQWSDLQLLDSALEHDLVIALAIDLLERKRLTLDADALDALDR